MNLTDRRRQLEILWQTVFHDSDEYVRMFFDRVYQPENTFVIEQEGKDQLCHPALCICVRGLYASFGTGQRVHESLATGSDARDAKARVCPFDAYPRRALAV